jgi:hypothetical protein
LRLAVGLIGAGTPFLRHLVGVARAGTPFLRHLVGVARAGTPSLRFLIGVARARTHFLRSFVGLSRARGCLVALGSDRRVVAGFLLTEWPLGPLAGLSWTEGLLLMLPIGFVVRGGGFLLRFWVGLARAEAPFFGLPQARGSLVAVGSDRRVLVRCLSTD